MIVGRVTEVSVLNQVLWYSQQQSWRVDVNGVRDATLPLSAINFGGTQLRRLNQYDERNIRSIDNEWCCRAHFVEGDLISAEVHAIQQSGQVELQTRISKFGKLANGLLVSVPSQLIKVASFFWPWASEESFLCLPIWSGHCIGFKWEYLDLYCCRAVNCFSMNLYGLRMQVSQSNREKMSRVRNCVVALSKAFSPIYPESIYALYEHTVKHSILPHRILNADVYQTLPLKQI